MPGERPKSELEEMAERIANVINGFDLRTPIKAEDIDLRNIAELCWALGITPSLSFIPVEGRSDG